MTGSSFIVHSWGLEAYLAQQLYNCGTYGNISVLQPCLFLTKNIESLFNTVLGQDSLICDDVGWWGGFKKGGNSIDDADIGFCNTMEVMGTNN